MKCKVQYFNEMYEKWGNTHRKKIALDFERKSKSDVRRILDFGRSSKSEKGLKMVQKRKKSENFFI